MNLNDFSASGSTVSNSLIKVKDGVELSTIRFPPKDLSLSQPLDFIPGWGSLIDGWKNVLKKMTEKSEVYYIESREKSSALHT